MDVLDKPDRPPARTPGLAPAWLGPLRGLVTMLGVRYRLFRARKLPRDERVAAAFAIDALDLVWYETLSPVADYSELTHLLLHEGLPFRTHAQWCAARGGGGVCDCGAEWQAFLEGESGRELVTMAPAEKP